MTMPRGRPRAFDTDNALDQALQVFWRKGYEGASVADLTEAMGITAPSLYAAFGNKEGLFRQVLDRYAKERGGHWTHALNAPTAREFIERLLRGTAEFLANEKNPPGCLMIQGALSCGEEADPIRQELILRRAAGEITIRERLERAKAEGDLPADADPADLASYVATVIGGMCIQATNGAGRDALHRVVDTTMRALPA